MTLTRVLYISGSIGLGHAGGDLAIANELRSLRPEIELVWLAGDPARRLLEDAGETLLPQSAAFAEETGAAARTTSWSGTRATRSRSPSASAPSSRSRPSSSSTTSSAWTRQPGARSSG